MPELADVCHCTLLLDDSSEELLDQGYFLKKVHYAIDLKVKQLLCEQMTSPKLISGVTTGVKLPNISIHTLMVIL